MTSVVLPPAALPPRLVRRGWRSEVHVVGSLPDPERSVAIVGARAATMVAVERAFAIARHLASHGVHVVSGGALGVDGAAHRGALAGGGATTVVLGTGIDVWYPARHAPLFRDVIAKGGALVSMFPDGSGPRRHSFTKRNELIAVLADVVIVVEADVRSGSLSTANAAAKHGRRVAAWPGSRGCDQLLAEGAALVEGNEDALLAALGTPRERPPVTSDPVALQVQGALDRGCETLDDIVSTTGLAVRAVLRVLPLIEQTRKQ